MSETVKIWIEEFQKNSVTVDEEIAEVKVAISNERLWAKGSDTEEQVEMHLSNIEELNEYLEWLHHKKEPERE